MNPLLSRRDIEALSAYLDGELDSRERARVEILLNEDPEMREALNTLQQTRALVRSLPKVKAPRNFTLSPDMVGQQDYVVHGGGLGLTMRWASAIASILLVLVFVGDVLTGGLRGAGSQPVASMLNADTAAVQEMQAAEPVEIEAADEADGQAFAEKSGEAPLPGDEIEAPEMAAEPDDEEPLMMEAAPEAEVEEEIYGTAPEEAFEADEATAEESDQPSENAAAEMAPQPTATAAADTERVIPTDLPENAGGGLPETEIQPEPQATPTMAGTLPPPAPADAQAEAFVATQTSAEEQAEDTGAAETDLGEAPPVRRISTLRIIEIVLLLAALGSGITAFIFRRRSL